MKKIIKAALFLISALFLSHMVFGIMKNNPKYIIEAAGIKDANTAGDRLLVFSGNYLGFWHWADVAIENKGLIQYKGRDAYRLIASGIIPKLVSRFYNVSMQAESYVDKERLNSLRFSYRLSLPDKPAEESEVIYDQEKNIMELDGEKRKILPGTQDFLSAIFYIQRQEFSAGKEFDININTNQKNYRFYLKAVRDSEIEIKGEKFRVWVIEGDVRRRDKSARHAVKINMWLLERGGYCVPLLVKVMTNIGPLAIRLISSG
ncbi:MAG: DUF3108 domain-containing protein [Candidatus Omnitrophota bacterium]